MNHKLRVLVRVDANPGNVTLEVTGCLTQPDFASLLQIMRRAGHLGAGAGVVIDLHGSAHLDPEILLQLRSIAAASGAADSPDAGAEPFRVTLTEPAELPICLLHVGSDGEVLAGLEEELAAFPLDIAAESRVEVSAGGALEATGVLLEPGLNKDCSPVQAAPDSINGLELSDYFEGTLDPGATVRALSDAALDQLADALYQHLDTSNPSFGAHTWYELATEELQKRHRGAAAGPPDGEFAAGQALA
ncbi:MULTISPECIES: hypothetical protein [unclassified Arthrobacter]|uniref:hypothetical protein n=1 Tax=unclassified Arthrobacter TaxID=235627 RepID=UPI002E11A8BE|nr:MULTISPECIES: hypothetical protein [unclassified Arthrobacter]